MKTLGLLLCLLLLPTFASSQVTPGYHRTNQVLSRSRDGVVAQVVPYAKVTVTQQSNGAAATIYSDPLLTARISPATVTADSSGNYGYYIPLNYCVVETISAPGQGLTTVSNVCQNSTAGGVVLPGTTYQLSIYNPAGVTTIGPSNVTTDSVGNNINAPGTVTAGNVSTTGSVTAASISASGTVTAGNMAPTAFNSTPTLTVAQLTATDACSALASAISTGTASGTVNASAYAAATATCLQNPFAGIVQGSRHVSVDIGNNLFQTTRQWIVPAQTYLTGADGNLANGIIADSSFNGLCQGANISVSGGVATFVCPTAVTISPNDFFVVRGTGTDLDTTYKALTVSADRKTLTATYGGAQTGYTSSGMVGCTFDPASVTVTCGASTGLSVGSTVHFSYSRVADLDVPASAYTVASTPTGSSFTIAYAGLATTQTNTFALNVNAATLMVPLVVIGDGSGQSLAVAGSKLKQLRVSCNGNVNCPVAVYSDTINEDSGVSSVLISGIDAYGFWVSQDVNSWQGGGAPSNWNVDTLTVYEDAAAPVNVAPIFVDNAGDLPRSISNVTVNADGGLAAFPICGMQLAHTNGGVFESDHFERVVNGICIYSANGTHILNATTGYSTSSDSNSVVWIDQTSTRIKVDQVFSPGATTYSIQHGNTSVSGSTFNYVIGSNGGASCMAPQSGCPFSVAGSTAVKGSDGQGYRQVAFQRFNIPVSGGQAQSVTITATFPSTADVYTRGFECFVDLSMNLQQQYTERYVLSINGGINLTLLSTGFKGDGTNPPGWLTNPVLIGSPATGFSFDVANTSFAFGTTYGSVSLTCPNYNSPVVGSLSVGTPFVTTATTFPDLYLSGTNVRLGGSVYASAIKAASGNYCLQIDSNGNITNTGAACPTATTAAVIRGVCSGTAASSTTVGFFLFGQATGNNCTTAPNNNGSFVATRAGTFKNLSVQCATAGASASSGVITLYDNSTAEAVTCTVGTGTSCSDTTHTWTASLMHQYKLEMTTQATETLGNCTASVDFQ